MIFTRELAPDLKSECYHISADKNLLALLEGRNIHQFTHQFSTEFRYFIKEQDARKIILGKTEDLGQKLDYQTYRLAFRKIASSTNERTMLATIIPPSLCVENLQTVKMLDATGKQIVSYQYILYLCSIFNSFTYDYLLRLKVSANINFFFVYSTQVPRLIEFDRYFQEIVERAGKLICTSPEYDDLAKEIGLKVPFSKGDLGGLERKKLRAEIDGMVAHLYGLNEVEFKHILSTFPIVEDGIKEKTLKAFLKIKGN